MTRRELIQRSAMLAGAAAVPRAVFAQHAVQPTWDSLRDDWHAPEWMTERRLGIFIHWGLYSIPAHGNEWYAKHMYTSDVAWHTEHYGSPDKFGYKDFIPMFTVPQYRPAEWAELFRAAGAGYVVPVAEHHDGFAMWDSDVTRWCAGKMGPKRDLVGELAKAVRAQGMVFGLSSHRMEHHTFMYPAAGVPNDQFDPRYADFYGPPQPGEMNDGLATAAFQADWLARAKELVDKYAPQLVYFDNGVNARAYDKVKLEFAAHLYGRVKDSAVVTKDKAYLAGSVATFEKQTRAPKWIYPGPWFSDDTISTGSWGYVEGMKYRSASDVVTELIELTCKGGGLLLNISPKGDGSIPEEQQKVLREVGSWMRANGEAINGSRPWTVYGEGPAIPLTAPQDWRGGSSADPANFLPPRKLPGPGDADFRFTVSRGALNVFGFKAQRVAKVKSLAGAKVERVTLLGSGTGSPLHFTQTADALELQLPDAIGAMPYVLVVQGSRGFAAG